MDDMRTTRKASQEQRMQWMNRLHSLLEAAYFLAEVSG
jgi:hypothetical protein